MIREDKEGRESDTRVKVYQQKCLSSEQLAVLVVFFEDEGLGHCVQTSVDG